MTVEIGTVLQVLTFVIVGVAGWRGYLSTRHRAADDAAKSAMDAQAKEIEVLVAANTRLERQTEELAKTLQEARTHISRLEGVVTQMREENRELREMVMLEKVPTPMLDAMREVANEAIVRLVDALVKAEG